MSGCIITVTEQRLYTHTTSTWALEALAKERGLPFFAVQLDDFKAGKWVHADNPTIILHAAHVKISRTTIGAIKSRHRTSRVITLGSDSLYYVRKYPDRHHGLLVDTQNGFEFVGMEEVSLHLDLMNEAVEAAERFGTKAVRWYWTASQRGLDIAREVAAEPKPAPGADAICYANPNVSAPGGYRPRLTRELQKRGRYLQWGGTTDFVTVDENVLRDIYRLYRRSRVCLGTSSPSWAPDRAAKGWRDFVAPVLGLPVIYDDLPEVTDIRGPAGQGYCPIDTFGYEDWDGLAALLCLYDDDQYLKDAVSAQVKWVNENTLDKQFSRVFSEYNLWP